MPFSSARRRRNRKRLYERMNEYIEKKLYPQGAPDSCFEIDYVAKLSENERCYGVHPLVEEARRRFLPRKNKKYDCEDSSEDSGNYSSESSDEENCNS